MAAAWRIRDRATFVQLRKRGRRGRSGPLAITWLPGDADHPPEVGFAIGRAVGPAVVRNRLRRQLRAVVAQLTLLPGAYVITVAPPAASRPFGELQTLLTEAVDRATRSPQSRRRASDARP